MDISIWSASGLAGVAFYLVAYGALQFGLIRGSSISYTALNLIAASFVLVSLSEAFNLSSALIQISWIVLSVIGLVRILWERSNTRFTPTEQALLSEHFAALPPHIARKFLRLGQWQTVSAGTVLTRQGSPVQALTYIAEGTAEVRAHGAVVAQLTNGALIGEMTVMHGAQATADVEITSAALVFNLTRKVLTQELESDHEFALAVANSLQLEAMRKIDAANKGIAGHVQSKAAQVGQDAMTGM